VCRAPSLKGFHVAQTGKIWITVLMVMTLPLSADGADIRDGLAGHWGFYGNVLDSSGSGNHAQAHGDAALVDDPDQGAVVEFDGNGDYLQIPNSTSLNIIGEEITLVAWVYFDDVTGPPEIVIAKPFQDGQHTSPYFSYGLHMLSNGTPRFWLSLSAGARNAPGSPNFESGRWYHMAGVYDGAEMILYVDGEVSATTSVSGDIVGYDTPLFLGINGGRGEPMDGKIDDVAIFSRALTQEEIHKVMQGLADPTLASNPNPEADAADVPRDVTLAWSPGRYADTHDVYLGTAFDDVNNADRANPLGVLVSEGQAETSYEPPSVLAFGQSYYWRVDEVNATPVNTIFKGDVWSFTVEPFAYPIAGVIATSNGNSDATAGPENVVNGSGLNANNEHSIDAADMWLATPGAEPLWIQFEFDGIYKLHEMLVWNYNVQFELVLGFGVKDVTVEHSSDGATWTALGDVAFGQGTAMAAYRANTGVDFGGVPAKYVRLRIHSGHGPMGQFGLSEVRFMFIPTHAREPEPADGATDVAITASLAWRAGREAVAHEVYLGNAADELVLVGTVDAASYTPADLEFGAGYSWRVAEVNEAAVPSVWESAVWSFQTIEYAVVDDMESYNDEDNTIFDTWLDGFVNETGSTVGYFEAPFAERSIVNGGRQSMPLEYANDTAPFYSEAEYDLGSLDLTANGADTLRLFVAGQADNGVERLYVALEDTSGNVAVVIHPDENIVAAPDWSEWAISYNDLAAVNLGRVATLTIGVGDRDNPSAGGSGLIFIDDVGFGHRSVVE